MRAARVGEHKAVVLNSLYLRPFAASASRVGVGTGPPNALEAPKPTSSVRISSTFGAPLGAFTGWGKSDFESAVVRPMTPLNGGGGEGRTETSGGPALAPWATAIVGGTAINTLRAETTVAAKWGAIERLMKTLSPKPSLARTLAVLT